jgi:Glycosyltransferase 61
MSASLLAFASRGVAKQFPTVSDVEATLWRSDTTSAYRSAAPRGTIRATHRKATIPASAFDGQTVPKREELTPRHTVSSITRNLARRLWPPHKIYHSGTSRWLGIPLVAAIFAVLCFALPGGSKSLRSSAAILTKAELAHVQKSVLETLWDFEDSAAAGYHASLDRYQENRRKHILKSVANDEVVHDSIGESSGRNEETATKVEKTEDDPPGFAHSAIPESKHEAINSRKEEAGRTSTEEWKVGTDTSQEESTMDEGSDADQDDDERIKSTLHILRKNINSELAHSRRQNLKGDIGGAEQKSVMKERSGDSGQADSGLNPKLRGFAGILQKKRGAWDSIFLNSDNPWMEASGSKGKYAASDSKRSSVENSVEIWSHKEVRMTRGFQLPVCRMYGACVSKSGHILLPKSLEPHSSLIGRCGIPTHEAFVLGDKKAEARFEFVENSSDDDSPYSEMDLVERGPPRRAAHHFLADILKTLFWVDSIYGHGAQGEKSRLTRVCLIANGGNKTGPCSETETQMDVHPALYIRKESFLDDVWVPHFLQLLASSGTVNGHSPFRYLDLYQVFPRRRTSIREPAVCYRSITSSALSYGQMPASAFLHHNPFFSGNAIRRYPAPRQTMDKQACKIRVRLSDSLTGSTGLGEVANMLKQKAESLKKKLALTVSMPAQGPVSFSDQVQKIQEADILVAPHGVHLSNAIFMRKGSALIEVHPFSFESGMFLSMSKQFGLSYGKVSAEPDIKTFRSCITTFNTGGKSDDAENLVSAMTEAAEQFKTRGKSPLHLESDSPEYANIRQIKECARRQRLRLNQYNLFDEIWGQINALCKFV